MCYSKKIHTYRAVENCLSFKRKWENRVGVKEIGCEDVERIGVALGLTCCGSDDALSF
jgi:hypothetical protein